MAARPFVEVEREIENQRIKQWFDCNTLFHKDWEVLLEQEATDEVVLVFYDVLYHNLDCSDLIRS